MNKIIAGNAVKIVRVTIREKKYNGNSINDYIIKTQIKVLTGYRNAYKKFKASHSCT